jgi:TonB-linked SusC/RagA family outer membrane protein
MKKNLSVFVISCCFLLPVLAQQKTITGNVIRATDNLPVIGATVQVKGTSSGVITDKYGKYKIGASPGDTLEFRYVGMKVREEAVVSSNIIDVRLEYKVIGIDEVMVVGYGTQIKLKVTGSISKVSGESIKNLPVQSIDQALQGKSAGVFVESPNGKSSNATTIRIRGASSITASNNPLFVVDGIPVSTETFSQTGGAINPLASFNLNDVESVEILKDAASAAIYGSRGSNGVVLITTKKGGNGDTKLDFTVQSGFNEASHRRQFMNADEYIKFFREAGRGADLQEELINGDPTGTSTFWQEFVEENLKQFSGWAAILDSKGNYIGSKVNTDWQSLGFQRGKIFSAEMSASGGNDKLNYFTSLYYNNTKGILISNGMEKISSRLNIDNKVNRYLDLGLTLSLNRTDINQITDDTQFSTPMGIVALSPITPPRDTLGNLYNTPVTTYYNPLIEVEDATKKIIEYRSLINGYMNVKLSEGLKWRNEFGFDLYNMKENDKYGKLTTSYYGAGANGSGLTNYSQTQNITTKSYLDFLKSFGNINSSAVLGMEFQYTAIDNSWATGEQFPSDQLKTLSSAALITGASSTLTQYSFLSYFSRINLDYKAKYLITLSGRLDGSSRFGENNRYGFFPAASLGWVLSKEDFLFENKMLSFLKARTSYGLTGNSGIGNYRYPFYYGAVKYNGLPGLIPKQLPNQDLGWESTDQIDFGIDFGLFENRISGEIDYYSKKTRALLLDVPAPETSGYAVVAKNNGSVLNSGIEFALNTTNLTGKLTWNTSFNIAYNKNKVTDIGGQKIIDNDIERMSVVMAGQPIGVFYGAAYAGVDPANGDAIWYINQKDANGHIVDPKATTSDFSAANFVPLGNPVPPLTGAITNILEIKGFRLDFTFQGVSGNKIQLMGDIYMGANGVWFDNQLKSQLRSWKKTGDITDVPQARLGFDNGNQASNSRYISDGSYLKLRSVSLGYNVPKKIIEKIRLEKLRISLQGQNLLTFTRYIGWDPEVSNDCFADKTGIEFYSAPQPRSVILTISISL